VYTLPADPTHTDAGPVIVGIGIGKTVTANGIGI
jgi:hypothetical protein